MVQLESRIREEEQREENLSNIPEMRKGNP